MSDDFKSGAPMTDPLCHIYFHSYVSVAEMSRPTLHAFETLVVGRLQVHNLRAMYSTKCQQIQIYLLIVHLVT